MADRSEIEWTEATWNPVTGCERTSPGCDNCYALALARRLKAMGNPRYQRDGNPLRSGPGFGLQLHEDVLSIPTRWRRPRTIFVNSMSDLFQPDVPTSFIQDVFRTMNETSRHRFQILTKRSQRLLSLASELSWSENIWMGVSVETERYQFRIDHLREVPSAIRFLSLEPLLGPLPKLDLSEMHWVIVGGESGPGARPIKSSWVRDIRDQCESAGVPFFFKQWGGRTSKAGGRTLDDVIHDQLPA
ncbi:MAG TPA: phage Gp37/Gp68 family protein [Acidimicrobiales bacterium]|jgi:protein gp37